MLNILKDKGFDVIGVGKIGDIFALSGITETNPTHSNREGMEKASEIAKRDFEGLCFVNLVDFDMLFGHRQDAIGYAEALNDFDAWLGEFIKDLGDEDILIITADHGCDPSDESTDHTREYVPYITYGKSVTAENIGTLDGFFNIGNAVLKYFGEKPIM
jgi:phosphopentomutase